MLHSKSISFVHPETGKPVFLRPSCLKISNPSGGKSQKVEAEAKILKSIPAKMCAGIPSPKRLSRQSACPLSF